MSGDWKSAIMGQSDIGSAIQARGKPMSDKNFEIEEVRAIDMVTPEPMLPASAVELCRDPAPVIGLWTRRQQ